MIGQVAMWWFASTLIGISCFPIAWRIFGRLKDRGYGLSRALGLLIAGYALWMGATIGALKVDFSSALGCVMLLIGTAAIAGAGRWREILRWARENWASLLVMEGVFLAAFVLWSFVRANNPEITATEKPMELAFLNAILRAESFPPPDPWLSGHAISYYYFGYILLAFLTRLTSVASSVAFNLGNALWFALTALGAYSLIYNMLARRSTRARLGLALLGPLFLLLAGNLEGFLEILHARHIGWAQEPNGTMTSTFWPDVEIPHLENPPVISEPTWRPDRYLWWWQASRVVRDENLAGIALDIQPIDEFPFFSFLLADNHPHLLALPFALLAVGFALQVFMAGKRKETYLGGARLSWEGIERGALFAGGLVLVVLLLRFGISVRSGVEVLPALAGAARTSIFIIAGLVLVGILALLQIGMLPSILSRLEFWVSALIFGGLAFLNTWDVAIYFMLLMAVLWWTSRETPLLQLLLRLALTGIGVAVAALLLYLPWLPTFRSQLGGILPNVAFTTQFQHFLIMFGTLFIPIGVWLVARVVKDRRRSDAWLLPLIGLGSVVLMLAASLLVSWIGYLVLQKDPGLLGQVFTGLGIDQAAPEAGPQLVSALIERRLTTSWTALVLGLAMGAGIVLLLRRGRAEQEPGEAETGPQVWRFAALLAIVGAFLVLVPEFFYLRDFFNVRMNTVFKFFFGAWILWSLAAAYVVTELIPRGWAWIAAIGALIAATPQVLYYYETQSDVGRFLLGIYIGLWVVWAVSLSLHVYRSWPPRWSWLKALYALAVIPVFLGLLYSVQGVLTKTHNFDPFGGRTLDGTAYLADRNPDEYEAFAWISENLEPGVIVEAVGGSYTEYARVSTHTGFPTILGWVFHEVQWRGEQHQLFIGSREDDVRRIYESRDSYELNTLLELYGVDYVFVGPLEQRKYDFLSDSRLADYLRLIYSNRSVQIYTTEDPGR